MTDRDTSERRTETGFREALVVDGVYEMVATVSTLRLGRVVGPPGHWRFETLPEGVFAVLRRSSGEQPAPLQAAVTDENGLLHELDTEDTASRTSAVVLYLRAPERYYLWWTFEQERYLEVLENPAMLETEGTLVEVMQYNLSDYSPFLEHLHEVDPHTPTSANIATTHRTICHNILHRHPLYESRTSPLFDVTPTCVRTLFKAELLRWYAFKAHEASANNLATFEHAAAMIEAAEKGLRDRTLESRAAELFPSPEERSIFERFREYAWRCAATGMQLELFIESVAMHHGPSDLPPGGVPKTLVPTDPPDADWLSAARKIEGASAQKKHGPALHPYLQGITGRGRGLVRDGVVLSRTQQDLLADYFEAYLFGAALRMTTIDGLEGFDGPDHYRGRMAARVEDWHHRVEDVRVRARRLLEEHVLPELFLTKVAACYPDDPDLIDRYIDLAAYCGCPWWRFLANAEYAAAPRKDPSGLYVPQPWPFWKTMKARLKVLTEVLKGTGKVSKLLNERLSAYELDVAQANQMLNTVGRLELTFDGKDVDATQDVLRTERVQVHLAAVDQAGQARVSLPDAHGTPDSTSVLLRFVARDPSGSHGTRNPPGGIPTARADAWHPVTKEGGYSAEVPVERAALRNGNRFPAAFAVLAETVNLAIAIATMIGEASGKDKALATFDLTKGIVGVVESFPSAVAALSPHLDDTKLIKEAIDGAKNLKGLSTWLSRVDGAFKIYKGLDILFSDESDLQYELRHGRSFRAAVQRFSGVANVVVGAVGAAEIAGTVAAAAGGGKILGCSAALLAGFSATPWGLVLTIGGSILVAGSALVLDLAQPWNDMLMELERLLDAASRDEIQGPRLKVSTRLDALLDAVP